VWFLLPPSRTNPLPHCLRSSVRCLHSSALCLHSSVICVHSSVLCVRLRVQSEGPGPGPSKKAESPVVGKGKGKGKEMAPSARVDVLDRSVKVRTHVLPCTHHPDSALTAMRFLVSCRAVPLGYGGGGTRFWWLAGDSMFIL
jgi:hypothetical protein